MALIRWDPFSDLGPFREDFGRLLDRYTNWIGMQGWQPAMDLVENDNSFVLKVEVPGVDPEDLDVTVTDNTVVVQGSIDQEKENQREGYLRSERRYGQFARTIVLPAEIEPEKAQAAFKNGLLTITLPKTAPGRSHGVKVQVDRPQ